MRFDKPAQSVPEHVSGCRQFEGEDLRKYSTFLGTLVA